MNPFLLLHVQEKQPFQQAAALVELGLEADLRRTRFEKPVAFPIGQINHFENRAGRSGSAHSTHAAFSPDGSGYCGCWGVGDAAEPGDPMKLHRMNGTRHAKATLREYGATVAVTYVADANLVIESMRPIMS